MHKTAIKAKTSVTLSIPLLVKIDKLIGEGASRSAFIEKVLSDHLRDSEREAINRRDAAIINANADYLNREMEDVLKYQAPIDWTTEDN
jgi:metal-responsive CopG/Arc/MetJ family transcriptional regulator